MLVAQRQIESPSAWICYAGIGGACTLLDQVAKLSTTASKLFFRSHAKLLGLEGNNIVTGSDIHLHFPAGAVEKVTIPNIH